MSDEVDGGCELNLSATPEDAQSPHVSSLFRATVTGLKTRARDGSEWIVNYVNSSVAGVRARVCALENWKALVIQQLDYCSRMLEALKQGFEGTNQRLAKVEEQSDSSSEHSEVLDSIKRMQTRMEQRMSRIEDKIESLETRLDVIEKCLARAVAQSSVN